MIRKTFMLACSLFLLLGGQALAQNIQTTTLRVWMDDITVTADGTTATRLTVYENDAERDYTAFNMSLIVPEGISVKQVKKGRNWVNSIELSERAAESHTISCLMPEPTLLKIMCSSSQNDNLYPDDEDGNPMDELFTIDLIADPAMMNGTYTVTTEGIVFVYKEGSTLTGYVPDPLPSFQLTITGGQDGLSIPYTMTSAGIGTLVLPFDATVPTGLKVFTATDVVDGSLQLEEQTSIAAGTPLIVTGEAGTYQFQGAPATAETEFTEGVLSGVTEAKVVSEGYVLQRLGGVTGFYRIDPTKPVTVPAYRCWLSWSGDANVVPFRFDFDAINVTKVNAYEGDLYDLSGRRSDGRRAGVYIQQGKKTVKMKNERMKSEKYKTKSAK